MTSFVIEIEPRDAYVKSARRQRKKISLAFDVRSLPSIASVEVWECESNATSISVEVSVADCLRARDREQRVRRAHCRGDLARAAFRFQLSPGLELLLLRGAYRARCGDPARRRRTSGVAGDCRLR